MDINFGIGLKRFLFEQNIQNSFEKLKSKILEQTSRYMSFLNIIDIKIEQDQQQMNTMYCQILYKINPISKTDTLDVFVRN